ncbi:hypothetical protein [Haemophilus parahaemolyticus]
MESTSLFYKQDFYAVKAVSFTLNRRETLEYGAIKEVLLNPQHAITERLIKSHLGKKLTVEAWQK